jgi:hypothetical protein
VVPTGYLSATIHAGNQPQAGWEIAVDLISVFLLSKRHSLGNGTSNLNQAC